MGGTFLSGAAIDVGGGAAVGVMSPRRPRRRRIRVVVVVVGGGGTHTMPISLALVSGILLAVEVSNFKFGFVCDL